MAGKKGGLFSSIGNATGFSSFLAGSGKYLVNPISSIGQVAYENTIKPINEAKREMKQESARQQQMQAEAEALAADRERTAELGAEQRRRRAAQKAIAAGRGGRSGTILTSPLGTTSAPIAGGGKSLLGE